MGPGLRHKTRLGLLMNQLDILKNRKSTKYSLKELVLRVMWGIVRPFFYFSPRPFFGWRNLLLRIFGAKVGNNTHIYNTAYIYFPWNLEIGEYSSIGEYAFIYNLGSINIGSKVTVSQRVHLCAGTHDHTDPALPLLKPPIVIKDQVWVCADAFIGPNVSIGEGAIVGARAVVTKDIDPWAIMAGNPAKFVRQRELKGIAS